MAVDNTHTKYLRGSDKKAWNNYAEAQKAQNKLDNFFKSFNIPNLKKGDEYEIPVKKGVKKSKKQQS